MTLEDVTECLLGAQIVDEYDRVEDMQALALERGRKPASAPAAEGSAPGPDPAAADE